MKAAILTTILLSTLTYAQDCESPKKVSLKAWSESYSYDMTVEMRNYYQIDALKNIVLAEIPIDAGSVRKGRYALLEILPDQKPNYKVLFDFKYPEFDTKLKGDYRRGVCLIDQKCSGLMKNFQDSFKRADFEKANYKVISDELLKKAISYTKNKPESAMMVNNVKSMTENQLTSINNEITNSLSQAIYTPSKVAESYQLSLENLEKKYCGKGNMNAWFEEIKKKTKEEQALIFSTCGHVQDVGSYLKHHYEEVLLDTALASLKDPNTVQLKTRFAEISKRTPLKNESGFPATSTEVILDVKYSAVCSKPCPSTPNAPTKEVEKLTDELSKVLAH